MDPRVDKRPMTRGVTHLMYVGDDDAVETALMSPELEVAAGLLAGFVALQSRGITRLISGGIAALVGYRVLKAR